MITLVLGAASFILVGIAAAVAIYHSVLACVALLGRWSPPHASDQAAHWFAIVIPAHDEEEVIGETLRSCLALDYPRERVGLFVVADNCSDRTAEVALAHGASCLERRDPERRGKGHALQWAFERILPQGYDAAVVLDADCTLDPHALRVFDGRLSLGDRVLQANDVAANPEESAISYATAVANFLENDLFYAPKSRLGLAVFLRGTGMVLHRSVLERHPWRASSLAEDTEYTLHLIRDRIPVRFVPEVRATSSFPVDDRQLSVQRARWVGGNLSFSRSQAWSLIWEGLWRGNVMLCDAGWTLFNLVRSLIVLWVALSVALSGALAYHGPGPVSIALFSASLISAGLLTAYVVLGIFLFGLSPGRTRLLLGLPGTTARMVWIAARGLVGVWPERWIRAERAAREPLATACPERRSVVR
jgi:cellulose synthase/poly-beta-1,6-N-acetylglucosamine synthase-like glycosyltransferase